MGRQSTTDLRTPKLFAGGVLIAHVAATLVFSLVAGSPVPFLMFGLVPGVLGVAVWAGSAPGTAMLILGLGGFPLFFVIASVAEASRVEAVLTAAAITAAPIVAGLLFLYARRGSV